MKTFQSGSRVRCITSEEKVRTGRSRDKEISTVRLIEKKVGPHEHCVSFRVETVLSGQ